MFSSYDILPRPVIMTLLESSRIVQEHIVILMNAFASESIGRRYLLRIDEERERGELQSELVTKLVHMIKLEKEDNVMRQNILGIL